MKDNPLHKLQDRILGEPALVLEGIRDAKSLTNKLRAQLIRAFRNEILIADYSNLVRSGRRTIDIPGIGKQDVSAVWGGVEINRDRDPSKPHFRRVDGAWFDFHLLLHPYEGKTAKHRGFLELLGYGYEIRFPNNPHHGVAWLRFDLNLPGHDNESRGVRAHVHPGDEDLQAPAPVMHPEEALEVLLCELLQLPPKRA